MNRLHQLAINEEGFVFDPTTGESFTTNQTGLAILKGLRGDQIVSKIAEGLTEQFEVTIDQAERDVTDFIDHLRTHRLV